MSGASEVRFNKKLIRYIHIGWNNKAKLILIQNQNLINGFDQIGTLLHHAATYGNAEIAQHLIDMGIAVDFLKKRGGTALMEAVEFSRESVVKVLLEAGASIDIANADGETALQMAFRLSLNVDIKIVQTLLLKVKIETPSTEELIERLIANGCTLPHAAHLKNISVFEALLQRGSDVHSRNHLGQTALHVAAELDEFEMVKLLVNHGADLNVRDKTSKNPLYYATVQSNVAAVKLLLERGADANPSDRHFDITPLFPIFFLVDCEERSYECAEILLQHGATVQNMPLFLTSTLRCFGSEYINRLRGLRSLVAHLTMRQTTDGSTIESMMSCTDSPILADLQECHNQCQQALKFEVFGTTTLRDLLTDSEYKMMLRVRNETFVSKVSDFCLEHGMKELHSYYHNALKMRILNAERIVKLENEAILAICGIFQRNENECYLAARKILGYLSERDLQGFLQVWNS